MDQATVVSDLKMQLVELRQNIANNPTLEVSEDEDVDATPLGVPLAPPPAVPPAVPPENTPFDPAGDDMDDDLLEEANPPATKHKGEFGAIQVPTNKQEFQQWTAGLDRDSVREGLLHFQALNEQHESTPARLRLWNVLLLLAPLLMMKSEWVTAGLLSAGKPQKLKRTS